LANSLGIEIKTTADIFDEKLLSDMEKTGSLYPKDFERKNY